jgi:hypothetical protein
LNCEVASHPGRKNNGAARVGDPILRLCFLAGSTGGGNCANKAAFGKRQAGD